MGQERAESKRRAGGRPGRLPGSKKVREARRFLGEMWPLKEEAVHEGRAAVRTRGTPGLLSEPDNAVRAGGRIMNWLSLFRRTRTPYARKAPSRRHRVKPSIELLEDRVVP